MSERFREEKKDGRAHRCSCSRVKKRIVFALAGKEKGGKRAQACHRRGKKRKIGRRVGQWGREKNLQFFSSRRGKKKRSHRRLGEKIRNGIDFRDRIKRDSWP